jgi:hypothetical protein
VAGRVDINPPNGGRFAPRPDGRIIPAPSGPFDELVSAPPIHLVRTMPGCPPPGQCLVIAGGDNDRFGVSLAIPRATWGNSQIGVRLHTLAYNTEITALWLWNHDYDAVINWTRNRSPHPSARTPHSARNGRGLYFRNTWAPG